MNLVWYLYRQIMSILGVLLFKGVSIPCLSVKCTAKFKANIKKLHEYVFDSHHCMKYCFQFLILYWPRILQMAKINVSGGRTFWILSAKKCTRAMELCKPNVFLISMLMTIWKVISLLYPISSVLNVFTKKIFTQTYYNKE